MAIGLALTTRPALLQLVAVDGGGRELTVLGALPHAATEVASHPAAAEASLRWLSADLAARGAEGRRWPEMALVVEDLAHLAASESGVAASALSRILRSGAEWGMHVLAGAQGLDGGLRSAGFARRGVARLTADEPDGWFVLACGSHITRVAGVRLAVVDLDRVARGYRPIAAPTRGRAGRVPLPPGADGGWRRDA
jgi:hypothetical protein